MSRLLKFKSSDIINNVIFFFLFLIISNTAEWCFNQNFIIIIFGGILLIFLGKKLKVDFIAVLIACLLYTSEMGDKIRVNPNCYAAGDRVVIRRGPLAGMEGILTECEGRCV